MGYLSPILSANVKVSLGQGLSVDYHSIQVFKKTLLLFTLIALGLVYGYKSTSSGPGTKAFIIKKGDSLASITATLKQNEVINSEILFGIYAKILKKFPTIKAGEYEIKGALSYEQLFDLLQKGASRDFFFTLPEGYNRFDLANELKRQGFVAHQNFIPESENLSLISSLGLPMEARVSLEGFLFPETYSVPKNISAAQLIRLMTREFSKKWNLALQTGQSPLTPYETLILASVVEKETGAPEERRRIAGVFYNRLRKRMRLQSDPTTIYGLLPNFSGNITRKDLLTPHPWNTYTIPALPMTPICNPGLLAMEAARSPETHEFLYFVSHNDGTHEFSTTYEAHNAAVRNFQLNPKAREGKSWRQLKSPTSKSTD